MRLTVLDAGLRRERPGDRYASAVTDFRKSSFCGTSACVEVDFTTVRPNVLVRDGKALERLPFEFSRAEWDAFVAGVRAGEFDAPA